jgi:hypothetical protein
MPKELTAQELQELTSRVDELFGSIDLKGVSSESTGFDDLPEGYFLCEVKAADLTIAKSSGNPQVAFRFQSVENGVDITVDERTNATVQNVLKNTKNRSIFKYYTFKETKDVKKFVSDMLKFKIDEQGSSLPEEAFTNSATIKDALAILVDLRIYVNVSNSVNEDGTKSSWYNLISWKRAEQLGLPM